MASPIGIEEISRSDKIVVLMGPSGSGKTSFINVAMGQPVGGVGNAAPSHTEKLQAFRVSNPDDHTDSVVLVDTPGFGDTRQADTDVLQQLAEWLKLSYAKDLRPSGIIYLHRISDRRMAGNPLKNLQMFVKLCGPNTLQNAILVTTMWDSVDLQSGWSREKDLHDRYWKVLVDQGAKTSRFLRTQQSAWNIINQAKAQTERPLRLQEQIVELKMHLGETDAGIALLDMLLKQIALQQQASIKLRDAARGQADEATAKALAVEYDETQARLRDNWDQLRKIRVPFARRLRTLLMFKKNPEALPSIVLPA